MSKIHFVKMHGAGNDFVLVDDRAEIFPSDDHRRIAAMAMRPSGIGCEGVILVRNSDNADFQMKFYNPDGSEAELCGNGARCVAAFAKEIGVVTSNVMRFETAAGMIDAEILEDSLVRIAMPEPKNLSEDFVIAGVPHKIVIVDNLAKCDVVGEGHHIRMSAEFAPNGTNVDFVIYRAPDRVSIRTYERGVEGESGACGTGAVAAAIVGVAQHGLSFPVKVKTVHGFELIVGGKCENNSFSSITLTGPVKRLFEGDIDFDTLNPISE